MWAGGLLYRIGAIALLTRVILPLVNLSFHYSIIEVHKQVGITVPVAAKEDVSSVFVLYIFYTPASL